MENLPCWSDRIKRLKKKKIYPFFPLLQALAGGAPSSALICMIAETLYHRDDALLYIAYVMLIWAAPIHADRWHCSLWP